MATSKKSTGKKLKDPMSSVGATRVSLSVRQADGSVSKTHATCGHGLEKPLASYDPTTQSWKMFGDISLWGDCPLLVNLPPSGMTVNGVLFLQPAWAPITAETELSLWPTPTTQEVEHPEAELTETGRRKSKDGKTSHSIGLADAVRMWPTPTAHPDNSNLNGKFKNPTLGDAVKMWPTPTAVTRPMEGNVRLYRAKVQAGEMTEAEAEAILGKSVWEAQGKLPATYPTPLATGGGGTGHWNKVEKMFTDGQINYEEKMALQAGRGGKLNPTWVEWLMGFPQGWTDLED